MKKAFVIVILGLAVTLAAGQTAKPGWKGTIAAENGIKTVSNPAEPLYGTFAFDLQEELTLGGDPEKADAYFPKGAQVNVDDEGNLYVSDGGNRRIQVFDKTGRFLRPLGRMGQGPGEYAYPGRVQFDAEGRPCVVGGRDVLVYGKDGIFQRKLGLEAFFMQAHLGPGGIIVGFKQPSAGQGNPRHILAMLNPEGKEQRTIAEFQGEFDSVQRILLLHWYGGTFGLTPLSAETFAFGFSDEYKITVADQAAKPRLLIRKEEKPEPITAKEKEATAENGVFAQMGASGPPQLRDIRFPDHRPYFSRFLSDDAGRIYVIRFKSILEKTTAAAVDVFAKEGVYLYRMTWPRIPALIKGGALYEVRQDPETGETTVVRSRIKNWGLMKNG
jgi:hypothetical protein